MQLVEVCMDVRPNDAVEAEDQLIDLNLFPKSNLRKKLWWVTKKDPPTF